MRRRSRTPTGNTQDEDRPANDRPAGALRKTEGICKHCRVTVGQFYNNFYGMPKTNFFLPVLEGSWTSKLQPKDGKPMMTSCPELDGCLVQQLACPNPDCNDILGIRVVDSSEGNTALQDRDFFKLSRIRLRYEISPGKFEVAQPHTDPKSKLPKPVHESAPPSIPDTAPKPSPSAFDMQVEEKPPQAHNQPHPPGQSTGAAIPSNGILHKTALPSPSPAVRPVHDAQFTQPAPRESTAGLTNRTRDPHLITHAPAEQQHASGHHNPRLVPEDSLDPFSRMQTQLSQCELRFSEQRDFMTTFTNDIQRQQQQFQLEQNQQGLAMHQVQENLRALHWEVNQMDKRVGHMDERVGHMQATLNTVVGNVQNLTLRPTAPGTTEPPDSALEMLMTEVKGIADKANGIRPLEIALEMLKKRIQRLEEAAAPCQPSSHSARTVPSSQFASPALPNINTPVNPIHRQPYSKSHGSHVVNAPEGSNQIESVAQPQSAWPPVDASTKRAHAHVESQHEPVDQQAASPKRPKLVPMEPRPHPDSYPNPFGKRDRDGSEPRLQSHSHTLPPQTHSQTNPPENPRANPQANHPAHFPVDFQTPSRTPSHTSLPNPPIVPSSFASQPLASQHMMPLAISSPDGILVNSRNAIGWDEKGRLPDPQPPQIPAKVVQQRISKRRGRGGGPGSRGGRPRKSVPVQEHGTPEWEQEGWQDVPEDLASPDGYYSPARPGRDFRRGVSGGEGSTRRAGSLEVQGATPGASQGAYTPLGDPYAHTKKTRTKPVRNADGILIRKDGRPDMRSQSSAANLRKVHARKEERKSEGTRTPTSNMRESTGLGSETPGPGESMPPGQDLTASVLKKHKSVLGKMFPGGIDASRKEHDYTKVFEDGQPHTATRRGAHHHQQNSDARSERHIKQEQDQYENQRQVADSQSLDEDEGKGEVEDGGEAGVGDGGEDEMEDGGEDNVEDEDEDVEMGDTDDDDDNNSDNMYD